MDFHTRALEWTGGVVGRIPHNRLDAPTPCADWTVADLLQHVVAGNLWTAELAAGKTIDEVGDRLDGDVLREDITRAYARSADLADAAFRAPGALDAPCAVSYGPVPGSVYCGHRLIDVLVHGWDLAVSTGRPSLLPADTVEACFEVLEPQLAALQASGAFGTPVRDLPATAARQEQLLAALGRDPNWVPTYPRL
ncbi:MAG: TIGR03086 family protein [Anaerolineales bacterium]|nr:TIGR03086 family protein [Anaerolineales bacterium]